MRGQTHSNGSVSVPTLIWSCLAGQCGRGDVFGENQQRERESELRGRFTRNEGPRCASLVDLATSGRHCPAPPAPSRSTILRHGQGSRWWRCGWVRKAPPEEEIHTNAYGTDRTQGKR